MIIFFTLVNVLFMLRIYHSRCVFRDFTHVYISCILYFAFCSLVLVFSLILVFTFVYKCLLFCLYHICTVLLAKSVFLPLYI